MTVLSNAYVLVLPVFAQMEGGEWAVIKPAVGQGEADGGGEIWDPSKHVQETGGVWEGKVTGDRETERNTKVLECQIFCQYLQMERYVHTKFQHAINSNK